MEPGTTGTRFGRKVTMGKTAEKRKPTQEMASGKPTVCELENGPFIDGLPRFTYFYDRNTIFSLGKSTISTGAMFNSELLNDPRVYELLVTVSARWVKYLVKSNGHWQPLSMALILRK